MTKINKEEVTDLIDAMMTGLLYQEYLSDSSKHHLHLVATNAAKRLNKIYSQHPSSQWGLFDYEEDNNDNS